MAFAPNLAVWRKEILILNLYSVFIDDSLIMSAIAVGQKLLETSQIQAHASLILNIKPK